MGIPEFEFRSDNESKRFCNDIIEIVVKYGDITLGAAVEWLNTNWCGHDFVGEDKEYLRYHRREAWWATKIVMDLTGKPLSIPSGSEWKVVWGVQDSPLSPEDLGYSPPD